MAAGLPAGIHKIPLAQFVPSPCNVRSIRTPARIEEIARSQWANELTELFNRFMEEAGGR
ncbi:MAG: hypothetical protein LBB76_07650 [Azoarcus sp.]|nr:hypothetical protein [Azoarcus sp.]